MNDVQRFVAMLQSPHSDKRFDACEELRVAPWIPAEVITALRTATRDSNPAVADAAKRALALHMPGPQVPARESPHEFRERMAQEDSPYLHRILEGDFRGQWSEEQLGMIAGLLAARGESLPLLPTKRRLSSAQGSCLGVIGLCWLGTLCLITLGNPPADPVLVRFTLRFTLAASLLLAVWIFRPMGARLITTQAAVSVTNDYLRPGEKFNFTYQQTFKRASSVKSITVQFIFREEATGPPDYDGDRITQKHDNIVQTVNYPSRKFAAGEMFSDTRALQVPSHAMHTFTGSDSKLRWLILVTVIIQGWPTYREEFEITVAPWVDFIR